MGLPESQRVSAGLTLSFCPFSFTTGNSNRPQHQCDKQSVSSSVVQRVWLCACVGVGVWAGYRWACLLPVTLPGLNYSSCCGCWSVTCRVPRALMNSPRPECARKKYNEAKRTPETQTRTVWERVTLFLFNTFSVAPYHKVMKRLAAMSQKIASLITWQTCNWQLFSQWAYPLLSDSQ